MFFSDSQASLVEGRGIGSTLFALEIILQYLDGYQKVMLYTEEVDGQGRRLREFWERLGFKKTSEEGGNITMEVVLREDLVGELYYRFVAQRG